MLPNTHEAQLQRARIALEGLSVGDALGGFFEFSNPESLSHFVKSRSVPDTVWRYTDDTNMALSIFQILRRYGEIKQDELAASFAHYFHPSRGYGMGAHRLLSQVKLGMPWRKIARDLFYGTGSYGNGGAMRVAPVGAYFADDIAATIKNATLSAEITHAHPEGIAGAVAVALGAAYSWQLCGETLTRQQFINRLLPHIPESAVREGVQRAHDLPEGATLQTAVRTLGNGSRISAQDTVPFVLWSAGEHLNDYEKAIWETASAGGDVDTTCAMVGGIVAGCVGHNGIPKEWIAHREPLPDWAFADADGHA